jgi:DNA-binding NtrC family response regulator
MSDPEAAIRVLLIDGEAAFLAGTARALTARGFAVTIAADAGAARRVLTADFDVAVLDDRMPGTGGGDLFDEIRSARPAVRVVMLTAAWEMARVAETKRRGAFEYLVKPCDPDELATVIRDAAQAARAGPGRREAAPEIRVTPRVLVAAERKEFLRATARSLARHGMSVLRASTAADCLDQVRRHAPDVVVVQRDLAGPVEFEFVAAIRRARPTLGVIVLSEHEMDEAAARRASVCGAHACVPASRGGDELARAVRAAAAESLRAQTAPLEPKRLEA